MLSSPTQQHSREQLPTYLQCTSPCIQLWGSFPSGPCPLSPPHVLPLQHSGCPCDGCISIHLFVNMNFPCCSESLHIIPIDSALLMIKYNVLQSLRLTGKLDWIYCFEVGWVVFSYVADLFSFFLPCGTLCHFANEELPYCLLIKASICEAFTSSCLIRQLMYCMPHHHLCGPLFHSHHKQSSSCRSSPLS